MQEVENNMVCLEVQNLQHLLIKCRGVEKANKSILNILDQFLGQKVHKDFMYISFNHRNKKKLVLAIWFSVKVMYQIYQNKCINKAQLLAAVKAREQTSGCSNASNLYIVPRDNE